MMRQQLWTAILTTSAEIERRVASGVVDRGVASASVAAASAIAAPARTRPPRLETAWRGLEPEPRDAVAGSTGLRVIEDAGERGSLGALQQQVRAQLDGLWSQLEGVPGFTAIRRALLIYFDERIMSTLPEYQRLSWSLLQTEHTGSTAGGDDFYRYIDAALDDPKTPSLVFEVDYFCLRHGFRGRYVHELAQIEAYERRLLQRIELSSPPASRGEAADVDAPPRTWPVWLYYVFASLLVIGFCLLVTALSNYDPDQQTQDLRRSAE